MMHRHSIQLIIIVMGLSAHCIGGQAPSVQSRQYQKWLTEDVPYIIEPLEKKMFLALKTDEEREQFIKEFWLRRDPDPDTPENEYRNEYNERVTYANNHFAFGSSAGWRADRGHVYIVLGKPDDVQTTSSGEIWTYNHLPQAGPVAGPRQKFEFVRVPGTADLRLKGGP
jgi:GWxTD domain-containing protein